MRTSTGTVTFTFHILSAHHMLKEGGEGAVGSYMKCTSAQSQNSCSDLAGDERQVRAVGNK